MVYWSFFGIWSCVPPTLLSLTSVFCWGRFWMRGKLHSSSLLPPPNQPTSNFWHTFFSLVNFSIFHLLAGIPSMFSNTNLPISYFPPITLSPLGVKLFQSQYFLLTLPQNGQVFSSTPNTIRNPCSAEVNYLGSRCYALPIMTYNSFTPYPGLSDGVTGWVSWLCLI